MEGLYCPPLGLSGSTSAEEGPLNCTRMNTRGSGKSSRGAVGPEVRPHPETALSRFPGLWLPEGVCGR